MPKLKLNSSLSIEAAFDRFILAKRAQGLSNKSLTTYEGHLKCISHHLCIAIPLQDVEKRNFDEKLLF